MKFEEGLITTPFFIIIYGAPGVGKSSFCANAPEPVYLDVEEGTKKIDVKRVSGFENYEQFLSLINMIIDGSRLEKYKTIIIDTIDFLEQMIIEFVCRTNGKNTLSDFSYGKGYQLVSEQWFTLLDKLSIIRANNNKNIIFIAHEQIKKFENPLCDSYDRFTLKLSEKTANFIVAKCDAVFFMSRAFILSDDKTDKERKIAKKIPGRTIYTEETPSIIAKNRYGLPGEIKISEKQEDYSKFFERLF